MLPDISEFSFGFGLTNELVTHYPITLTGAPRFPTQNEEGRVGGYDVELPRKGAPFFLQFKRSEKMVRGSAAHTQKVGKPHYRMHLRPRRHSDQHALLLDLEHQGHEVYYAAPRFHTYDELNSYYLNHTIADHTSFILPSWVGKLPDDRDHFIAISSDGTVQHFCSNEPRKIRSINSHELLRERVVAAARARVRPLDEAFFTELGDRLVAMFVERAPERRRREQVRATEVRRQRSPDEYAREVAQMLYGCELLLVLAET